MTSDERTATEETHAGRVGGDDGGDPETAARRAFWRERQRARRERLEEMTLSFHPHEMLWLIRQARMQGVHPGLVVRVLLARAGMPYYSYCARTRTWKRRKAEG